MKTFQENIINQYGEKGRQWLEYLPSHVAQIATAYHLSNLKPVNNLSYNYVLSGFQNSQPIILKLGFDVAGLQSEAAALHALQGFGIVQVLAEDSDFLLLACAVPGVPLKSYFPEKDNKAIHITANVIKRLHKAPIPNAHAFPHIKDWLAALDNDLKIPVQTLQKARQLRDQLLKTATSDVLLHGDLHHDNILQNGQDWMVIDPKGVIGESVYEVAAFIRNPMPELLAAQNAAEIIQHRIAKFADLLGMQSTRILDWCFVQSVLAWAWSIEDGCDISYFKNLTEIFEISYS